MENQYIFNVGQAGAVGPGSQMHGHQTNVQFGSDQRETAMLELRSYIERFEDDESLGMLQALIPALESGDDGEAGRVLRSWPRQLREGVRDVGLNLLASYIVYAVGLQT